MPDPSTPQEPEGDRHRDPFAIEFDVAHPARIQNYLAGGDANFTVDRDAAEHMGEALPGGVDTAKAAVRSLGAFVGRSVRYLAGEVGMRQFVNIGVAVPTQKNVHEAARQATADTRFVYVDNDPIVLARSHDLRTGAPEGNTAFVHGSLHDPVAVLEQASATLDLTEPVAVLLPATLSFVPDDHDPHGLVAKLMEGLVPGSHLVVAHSSADFGAEGMAEASARLAEALRDSWSLRRCEDILRFFAGLELVPPGLVQIDEWRSEGPAGAPVPAGRPTPIYAGVGRKP